MPFIENKFIRVVNNHSPSTILVFSSAGIPEGKFSGSNLFSGTDANLIFVNAPGNNWFIGEIPGVGENVSEIASYLERKISELNSTDIYFYGGSMGGFGALLYGSILGATRIFSTGVESKLGIKGGFFNRHCFINKSSLDYKYLDITKVIGKNNDNSLCLFGELSHVDLQSAKKLQDINCVRVNTIVNEDHSLPPLFDFYFNYQELIKSYFFTGNVEIIEQLSGNIISDFPLSDYIYQAKYLSATTESEIESNLCNLNSGVNLSYALAHLGVCRKRRNMKLDAIELFRHSISLNEGNFIALYSIADLYNDLGEFQLAEHYSRRSLAYLIPGFRPLYNAAFSLITALTYSGKLDEARFELSKLNKRLPKSALKNPHIKLRLNKVNILLN